MNTKPNKKERLDTLRASKESANEITRIAKIKQSRPKLARTYGANGSLGSLETLHDHPSDANGPYMEFGCSTLLMNEEGGILKEKGALNTRASKVSLTDRIEKHGRDPDQHFSQISQIEFEGFN